jgi:hypothetical protein
MEVDTPRKTLTLRQALTRHKVQPGPDRFEDQQMKL